MVESADRPMSNAQIFGIGVLVAIVIDVIAYFASKAVPFPPTYTAEQIVSNRTIALTSSPTSYVKE